MTDSLVEYFSWQNTEVIIKKTCLKGSGYAAAIPTTYLYIGKSILTVKFLKPPRHFPPLNYTVYDREVQGSLDVLRGELEANKKVSRVFCTVS